MLAMVYCISVEEGPKITIKDFMISVDSNRRKYINTV